MTFLSLSFCRCCFCCWLLFGSSFSWCCNGSFNWSSFLLDRSSFLLCYFWFCSCNLRWLLFFYNWGLDLFLSWSFLLCWFFNLLLWLLLYFWRYLSLRHLLCWLWLLIRFSSSFITTFTWLSKTLTCSLKLHKVSSLINGFNNLFTLLCNSQSIWPHFG